MRISILILLLILASPHSTIAAGSGGSSPYFEIQTPFVVNLADTENLSFLQVNAQLKIKNDLLKEYLYTHLPAIQHTVMLVLSEQTAKDVKTVAGKQKLRDRTLKEIQDLLTVQIGDTVIDDIYFTSFIVQ